jgi:TPR repeat protein
MNRSILARFIVVGFVASTAIYFWAASKPRQLGASAGTTPTNRAEQIRGAGVTRIPFAMEIQNRERKPPENYKTLLAESNDYWKYARLVLPAAKEGDKDAEFYLSRVLDRCAEGNMMYFQNRGKRLTLDEGLQFAVQRHLPIDVAQRVFERCHEFQEHDFADLGSPAEWLAKATDAGQPIAQATTVTKALMEQRIQNIQKASGSRDSTAPQFAQVPAAATQLLREAVQSMDPEVLFIIGELQNTLKPANPDTSAQFAWWLVACERGFDCSSNAEWVKTTCAGDPQCASAAGPSDLVRYLAGDKWPEVQEQAKAISAKLSAGQWESLDLGPSS